MHLQIDKANMNTFRENGSFLSNDIILCCVISIAFLENILLSIIESKMFSKKEP